MKNVTRTKRIYNSYSTWGRFKSPNYYFHRYRRIEEKCTAPKSLEIGIPYKDPRWHPYHQNKFGYLDSEKSRKKTNKAKIQKFEYYIF